MRSLSESRIQNAIFAVAGVLLASHAACRQPDTSGFRISRVGYRIGSGELLWAKPGTIVESSAGDELFLLRLEFVSQTTTGSAWAEAYYHDSETPGEGGVVYGDGQFTFGKELSYGDNVLAFKGGSWILESTFDRFVVALIHQFGARDDDFRKVDTVNFNLRVRASKK